MVADLYFMLRSPHNPRKPLAREGLSPLLPPGRELCLRYHHHAYDHDFWLRYLDIRMTVWLLFCLILPLYHTIAPMFTPGIWGLDDCDGHAVVPSCIKYTEPESVIIIRGQIKHRSCLFCFKVEWSSLALTSASNCLGLLRAGTTGVDGHTQLHSAHFLRSNTL